MVVGNGLLAKAFSEYSNNNDVIIYASGVSNSTEKSKEVFQRETNLLKECISKNKNKLIIYFSTCSVSDVDLKGSDYVLHKLNTEKFIQNNVDKFIIFRLPIVVGKTDNKFTLFNFFKNKISKNEEVTIQKNATRYLVDIDDVFKVLSKVINSNQFTNCIIECSFSQKISVISMVDIIKKVYNSSSEISLTEGGGNYDVDNSMISPFLDDKMHDENYNESIIKKYINHE